MSEAKEKAPHVFVAIAEVTAKLGHEGIAKDRKNEMQNYKFRGIDDVYNALSSALSDAKLCILPRVTERNVVERATKNGGALFYVTVKVEFDFVSAVDGSKHVVTTYGEAMDSADKATNKAMSAAYKYAAMQAFCIPTEGDNDADASTHEVAGAEAQPKPPKAKVDKAPPKGDALADALNAAGCTSKAGKLMFCSDVAKREIKSPNDLTPAEWQDCLEAAKKAVKVAA